MPDFVKVATVEEMPEGEGLTVAFSGKEVALFKVSGQIYAIDNVCRHAGGPLGDGFLEGEVVTCPWHGWTYNVKTGASLIVPSIGVKTYQVKVEGSDVLVADK